jgi:hypothetical protein
VATVVEDVAPVEVVEPLVVVVDELEEFPHPASPRTEADRTTNDHMRKRDIE